MISRLVIAGLVETLYAVFTRTWLREHYSGVELELLTTLCRLVAAAAFFALFRKLFTERPATPYALTHPLLLIALFVSVSIPILVGDYGADISVKVVFAITSVVVAVKEELLYRGGLQNIIERHAGPYVALVASNLIFTAYHYGAHPFTLGNAIEWFSCGVLLGTLYLATRSLFVPIAVHAVIDALWSLAPFLALPRSWGPYFEIPVLLACIVWAVRSNNAFQPTPSRSALGRG